MEELELFRTYPSTRSLPYTELAALPTPTQELPALATELGLQGLWVKRDDLSSPLYGGNKVRKLEFILGHALSEGHRSVWTVGAVGSHHVLATSLHSRSVDIEPHALHFPQPITDHVREVLLALSTAHPQLELINSKHALPVKMAQRRVKEWLSRAEEPYYIPGGGSSPRGVLGYVNAALELARQIEDGELPVPDAIFVAAGTCGTLAGLALGCRLAGLPSRIIGVRVIDKVLANPLVAANLANRTARLLADCGIDAPKIRRRDIEFVHDQIGPGYGEETPQGRAAIDLFDKWAEIELDPTYTAKAFAGLQHFDRQSNPAINNALYWHTLSSADLTPLIDTADISDLPQQYRQFFPDHS